MGHYAKVIEIYEQIKKKNIQHLDSPELSLLFIDLVDACQDYLANCTEVSLISKVPYKQYFSFSNGNKHSRAIRKDLYTYDLGTIRKFLFALKENNFDNIDSDQIDVAAYSIAITFCAIVDLEKSGDQKTPGTFFEYFIGHCFARRLSINPQTSIEVLNLDKKTSLPTDLIFDLGSGKPKFHVPIKTSTRERVIQVWAHQRVLDGVYGTGRFFGVLTCLSETKVDKSKKEVVEICLPQQWQLYQMFIAQMKRVYYLDLPMAYSSLNDLFPKIHVKRFSTFFKESRDFSSFD